MRKCLLLQKAIRKGLRGPLKDYEIHREESGLEEAGPISAAPLPRAALAAELDENVT